MTLTFGTNHGINTVFCAFRVKGLAVQYKDDIDSSCHLNNVLINSRVVPWQPYRNVLYDTEAYKEAPLYNHLGPAANAMALSSRYDRSGHAQKPPSLRSFWIWGSLDNCSSVLPFQVRLPNKPGHFRYGQWTSWVCLRHVQYLYT